jgi:hypothetical protein
VLARELAARTGESLTEAVIIGLRERLERTKRARPTALRDGDSNEATHAAPCCFMFGRRLPLRTEVRLSLTPPPRAVTVCPTANMFFAAFSSRSCLAPHSSHDQSRVATVIA